MIGRARLLLQGGRPADAALLLRQAVALAPDQAEPHHHLALVLQPVAAPALVERLIDRAVRCAPGQAEARANLSLVQCDQLRHDEAAASARWAVALNPAYANGHANLGRILKEQVRPLEAAICLRRVVLLHPGHLLGWINLGDALDEAGQVDAALAAIRVALALDPSAPPAWNNLGHLLLERGGPALRRAIRLHPQYAAAHLNLGMDLLRRGELEEGWREFEWWRATVPAVPGWQGTPQTRWRGQDLQGRTLLLRGEQGLGDMLQFARYAAWFARAGARVVLEVHPPLTRLLATVPGVVGTVPMGAPPPPYDYHQQMMSVPGLVGTRLDTIPADIPYLAADPAAIEAWRQRLSALPGPKIGLVWAGNPRANDPGARLVDSRRSMALTRLAPLLRVPGFSFVSLQMGEAAAQIAELAPELRLFDAMDDITDFADTAALCANLDLVISVDTSVVHLAGALGRPVWILSRHDGCWRWLLDRDDSPWYPTARLFRQRVPGDWDEVVARVAQALFSLRDIPRP